MAPEIGHRRQQTKHQGLVLIELLEKHSAQVKYANLIWSNQYKDVDFMINKVRSASGISDRTKAHLEWQFRQRVNLGTIIFYPKFGFQIHCRGFLDRYVLFDKAINANI